MTLTEEKVERPHAQMMKHRQSAPNSITAWKASSTRLPETLSYYDRLDDEDKQCFACEWKRFKRVVQTDPAYQERNKQIAFGPLCRLVYEQDTSSYSGVLAREKSIGGKPGTVTSQVLAHAEYCRS